MTLFVACKLNFIVGTAHRLCKIKQTVMRSSYKLGKYYPMLRKTAEANDCGQITAAFSGPLRKCNHEVSKVMASLTVHTSCRPVYWHKTVLLCLHVHLGYPICN